MPVCDISGKSVDKVYRVMIEGSVMHVAKEFVGHGKLLERPHERMVKKRPRGPRKDPDEDLIIRGDAGSVIKKAREREGFTQEELAKKLAEKESRLHKIESGHMDLSIRLARKIERFLKVSLVEQAGGDEELPTAEGPQAMTLGDYIKVK